MLKSVCLGFRKVKVKRVTVVEFGMYDRWRWCWLSCSQDMQMICNNIKIIMRMQRS